MWGKFYSLYRGKRTGHTAREGSRWLPGPVGAENFVVNKIDWSALAANINRRINGDSVQAFALTTVSGETKPDFCCGNTVQYSGNLDLAGTVCTGVSLDRCGFPLFVLLFISGFTGEKLCRHGSHRNAGIRSIRKTSPSSRDVLARFAAIQIATILQCGIEMIAYRQRSPR